MATTLAGSGATASNIVHLYAVKHDPFVYFKSVQEGGSSPIGLANIVGFEGAHGLFDDLEAGRMPSYAFIVPSQCNDQHGQNNATAACFSDPNDNGSTHLARGCSHEAHGLADETPRRPREARGRAREAHGCTIEPHRRIIEAHGLIDETRSMAVWLHGRTNEPRACTHRREGHLDELHGLAHPRKGLALEAPGSTVVTRGFTHEAHGRLHPQDAATLEARAPTRARRPLRRLLSLMRKRVKLLVPQNSWSANGEFRFGVREYL